MRKYIWKRGDGYSQPIGLTKLVSIAAPPPVTGRGPFVLTQDGDPISPETTRVDVLQRFRRAISHREIGPVFRIRKGNGEVAFAARAVVAVSEVNSTNGNSNCDVYFNWVRENFRAYNPRYAGAYVCKHIAGSSTMSQHSYGNAVDIFFDSFGHQDRVARAVVENHDALDVYHVISGQSIWTKGVGWTGYRGDFHAHLHVDFEPQYSGPCGVRG